MSERSDPIVQTYSRLAEQYDDDRNIGSCWGLAAKEAVARIALKESYKVVVDLGCGTGGALCELAAVAPPSTVFVGIEPAENMRRLAEQRNKKFQNVTILNGRFEKIPLDQDSTDYLYSIMAFHWATDLERSVEELARVLKSDGELDLFFIGRWNGREFVTKTTPIFRKYLGLLGLLKAAKLRKQLSHQEALALFSQQFEPSRLSVEESYRTYYDTIDGHWGWWVRIEGQFLNMPTERVAACERDVRAALVEMETPKGIPYTLHELHVRLRQS